ncbi:hypothetical protein [Gordonia jinghuaiqii]|uniref:Uncharacterized protein n=1 Tax=Gordonia jinghuaiqii TaxID=2758710 RepID=A0A7D7LTJ6_9ACTN|nr:hypothetical protein [Gordonia jinghuaiqii]QMT01161.1 hypothetical protein H1R19_20265 [Gordonia jinghuaiqii]
MSDRLIGVHDASGVIDSAGLRTVFGSFPSGITAPVAPPINSEPASVVCI